MKSVSFGAICLGVAVIIVISPVLSAAQSVWLSGKEETSFTLEYLKPQIDDYSVKTVFFTARTSISNSIYFVADIPYAHSGYRGYYYYESHGGEDELGNPYIGFEFWSADKSGFIELGLRPPFASDEQAATLLLSSLAELDRQAAFYPDYLSFQGLYNHIIQANGGISARLRAGPEVLIYTGDLDYGDKTEWFFHYNAYLQYESSNLNATGGVTGLVHLSEDGQFDEKSVNMLRFSANAAIGKVWPGLEVRYPIDDWMDNWLDMVLGLNVQVLL